MKKILTTIGCTLALAPSLQAEKLNVILILTDDVGYGDVSYTGNTQIITPAMQQLHDESICFDNFHTGTTSAPSRSGLMTGIDGNRTGVWHTIAGRSLLDLNLYTMGEAFKDSGYKTAMFGKWHLGDNYPYRPCDRGFDNVLCLKGGGIGQLPDYWGNTYYDDTYYRDRDIPEKQDGYCTDIFVGETERFATENRDKPFFVYLALNSAHAPFNVDAEYSDLYKGNTAAGNPKICGMITNIDDNIARLRETLKEQGLDKNTVIILFGDNGSNNAKIIKDGHVDESVGYNGGFRGKKSQPWEGGHRQAMLMHIPSQPLATTDTELAMCYDLMPTLINLCGLTPSRDVEYDGVDLLSEESRAGRVAVVDTQRSEFLRKYAPYAVMKDDWRLIDGKSLYNLSTDRAQKLDVADSHPELVAELKNSYEEWWERTSVDKDLRHPIPLSTNIKGESVLLNGHDIHTTNGKMPVWNQQSTCQGKKTEDGFWSVEVTKSGKYDFELYRWAPSSGLNLNEATPRGREIPNNGARYPAGGAITNMKRAAIVVDDVELASCEDFPLDRPSISIPAVKLPKGYHELKAVITDSDDQSYIAWFVNVRRR